MNRVVADEEKTLARVMEKARESRAVTTRKDYDSELLELRDEIGQARLEDQPALLAEMERLRNVASRRAEVTVGAVNASSLSSDARYGAFPTQDTWFISAGDWAGEGADDDPAPCDDPPCARARTRH
jgi:hypothetical protein